MLSAVKIRLYPNKEQEIYINKLLGSYRFVYNQCLALKKEKYVNNKENYGLKELGNFLHQELTKNNEYPWLHEHNTKVLKQSIINLLESYKRFFINGNGFPKFKSKHDNLQSCRFPLEAISKKNDYLSYRLTLTKDLKNIKFSCSEKYSNYLDKHKDNIKSATLSKTKTNKYFLSILVDGDLTKSFPVTNKIIGIDLGIKDFIITSDNTKYENIKVKRNNEKKLTKLHRELSRKQKGSKNKEKTRIKLAKLYERLTNIKQQYLYDISNTLLNENQVIVMENLSVKNMIKNHNLAKSIHELSLYRFKEILTYKANWYGRDIIQIDKFFPSSKLCSSCGNKNTELKLSDREWKCTSCNTIHDRDYNAALNILNEGKKILGNRFPELTPLESSGYTLDELGNRNLHNFV